MICHAASPSVHHVLSSRFIGSWSFILHSWSKLRTKENYNRETIGQERRTVFSNYPQHRKSIHSYEFPDSIKNGGPYQRTPKLLELLDTQVYRSVQWVRSLEISWILFEGLHLVLLQVLCKFCSQLRKSFGACQSLQIVSRSEKHLKLMWSRTVSLKKNQMSKWIQKLSSTTFWILPSCHTSFTFEKLTAFTWKWLVFPKTGISSSNFNP